MFRARFVLFAVVAALAAWLTGCGANVTILRQAEPNPFIGQKSFAVMPLETKGLLVGEKSEEQYLAERAGL